MMVYALEEAYPFEGKFILAGLFSTREAAEAVLIAHGAERASEPGEWLKRDPRHGVMTREWAISEWQVDVDVAL